jgi:hypothetical protein
MEAAGIAYLESGDRNMLAERFYTPELAQVAYAVGDREAGEVAIIDPRRDIDV